jgi:hypothetical protein
VVTNTVLETLERIQQFVGDGSIYLHRRAGVRNPKHTACYVWKLCKRSGIVVLLQQIIPYLTGKREHAQSMVASLQRAAQLVKEV